MNIYPLEFHSRITPHSFGLQPAQGDKALQHFFAFLHSAAHAPKSACMFSGSQLFACEPTNLAGAAKRTACSDMDHVYMPAKTVVGTGGEHEWPAGLLRLHRRPGGDDQSSRKQHGAASEMLPTGQDIKSRHSKALNYQNMKTGNLFTPDSDLVGYFAKATTKGWKAPTRGERGERHLVTVEETTGSSSNTKAKPSPAVLANWQIRKP